MADASTHRVDIATSDGETLEAELMAVDSPRAAVLVTHPNPLMGGDMHTPVPAVLWRSAAALGATALRFNFRGVGRSTGTHDNGVAEQLDVIAALDTLAESCPGVPIILAGWSFGADVGLAVDDNRIAGWLLAAAPLRVVDPAEMGAASLSGPKVFATPTDDQFCPPDAAREITAAWTNTHVAEVDGTDHFFGGRLDALPTLLEQLVDDVAGAG